MQASSPAGLSHEKTEVFVWKKWPAMIREIKKSVKTMGAKAISNP
jgi:hypothetical protein